MRFSKSVNIFREREKLLRSHRLSVFPSFQLNVLKAAMRIPFGAVTTYGDLAKAVQQPKAARAVGGVMKRNPILLIIPCHRVINSQKRLTGFSAPGGWRPKAGYSKWKGITSMSIKIGLIHPVGINLGFHLHLGKSWGFKK